jgi:hypothetical protein
MRASKRTRFRGLHHRFAAVSRATEVQRWAKHCSPRRRVIMRCGRERCERSAQRGVSTCYWEWIWLGVEHECGDGEAPTIKCWWGRSKIATALC